MLAAHADVDRLIDPHADRLAEQLLGLDSRAVLAIGLGLVADLVERRRTRGGPGAGGFEATLACSIGSSPLRSGRATCACASTLASLPLDVDVACPCLCSRFPHHDLS